VVCETRQRSCADELGTQTEISFRDYPGKAIDDVRNLRNTTRGINLDEKAISAITPEVWH